jgi:hypothetical protein
MPAKPEKPAKLAYFDTNLTPNFYANWAVG